MTRSGVFNRARGIRSHQPVSKYYDEGCAVGGIQKDDGHVSKGG